jgi:DNA-directed RNA polymerase specialized sigma24 family protein
MRDPDKFDAFYKDARERLLVQTFALTGDLAASRSAVRDAFVVAWHRWRKLSMLDDPESVVRPNAWRLAQRRHTARVWHRDKDISPDVKATLDALGKLSATERRTLVLTQLAAVSMPQMAREVGLTREAAERDLQHAATQLSLALDIQVPALRSRFDDIAGSVTDTVRWPRATIVRRAGAARRRTHTAVGVTAAVAALVVTGSLVSNATGVRPTLDRAVSAAPGIGAAPSTSDPSDAGSPGSLESEPPAPTLPETSLLSVSDLGARYDLDWTLTDTTGNDDGTGMVLPCQRERYADPRGEAALVRVFDAPRTKKTSALSSTQMAEASGTEKRAKQTYRTLGSWFGDCLQERIQLLSTTAPQGVGDQAIQVVLRSWAKPQGTYVLGVARTGIYTTTTLVAGGVDDEAGPSARRAGARLLSSAVDKLCQLPEGGACGSADAVVEPRPPLAAGPAPAMLSEIDLPRVSDVTRPWIGTEPRSALTNDAASSCDTTEFNGKFQGKPISNNATRTFVIPRAKLPTEFGLTQSVGSLPGKRAAALVERVRSQLSDCDALNTNITRLARTDSGATSLTAWRLRVEVSDERTLTFLMAIVRDGKAVSQIGFLPSTPGDLSTPQFVGLANRALLRLPRLPAPKKG